MKQKLLALALCCLSVAYAADTYIPGTRVSYRLDKDAITDGNTGHLFVDEANSNNYVEFSCDKGKPVFYMYAGVEIMSPDDYDAGKTPELTFRVDSQTPKKVGTVTVNKGDDPADTSHLSTLAVEDKSDPVLFSAFKNASSKVALRVTRSNGRDLTLTFPVKGFAQAWAKLNNCK